VPERESVPEQEPVPELELVPGPALAWETVPELVPAWHSRTR
jgi:hypothetical protein